MAMKLPVISTTVTGIPEIVEDGTSGILVPPHDEHGLADAVIKLIEDSALRKELGENARKRVEEKFNIDRNIRRYIDLFSGNCAGHEGSESVYRSSSGEEPLRET
jgi:glycosyltransferase involved in cell wall biosynthesis